MEKNEKRNIQASLSSWGKWKRTSVTGLEFSSSTIEAKILEGKGKIYDSGCYGGGVNPETKNKLRFNGSQEQLTLDTLIRRLKVKHPKEMEVVILTYVMDWSNRKIAKATNSSRHTVNTHLNKAIRLISVGLEL